MMMMVVVVVMLMRIKLRNDTICFLLHPLSLSLSLSPPHTHLSCSLSCSTEARWVAHWSDSNRNTVKRMWSSSTKSRWPLQTSKSRAICCMLYTMCHVLCDRVIVWLCDTCIESVFWAAAAAELHETATSCYATVRDISVIRDCVLHFEDEKECLVMSSLLCLFYYP